MPQQPLPSYRLHKPTGQAVVTLNGRDHYLGRHGTDASRAAYDKLLAEWLANDRQPVGAKGSAVTVAVILSAYREHALRKYAACRSELDALKLLARDLRQLYGAIPAMEFRPRHLDALRRHWADRGRWSRPFINRQVKRVVRVFRWASGIPELVPASVPDALKNLDPLRRGETTAPEPTPVRPADEALVMGILPFLNRHLAAMVRLHLLTGARPGELCILRTRDIDRGGDVWLYRPSRHKTEYHGHDRVIPLGPQTQAILAPFLREDDPDAYLFSPAEAERERREALHAARVAKGTPLSCGNVPGSNAREAEQRRRPGQRYTAPAYRNAIAKACEKACPPPPELARLRVPARGRKAKSWRWESPAEWKARLGPDGWAKLLAWRDEARFYPYQLRHSAATRLRRDHGLDAAQVILGHQEVETTQVYALRNLDAAMDVARKAL